MKYLFSLLCIITCLAGPVQSASSFDHSSDMLSARLITAEDGVAPTASTISAGLAIDLKAGWKTYWKSPGQVGYPTAIDWSGSKNVKSVEFQWPAPERFVAFDIENYGYDDAVTHPLKITLERPGEPVSLRANVSLLVCSDICVPQDFELAVNVYEGSDIDMTSAEEIAKASDLVPIPGALSTTKIASATLSPTRNALTIALEGDTVLTDPEVFVDMGLDTAFGAPELRLSGTGATIRLPVLAIPETTPAAEITVVTGAQAAVFTPEITVGTVGSEASPLIWTIFLAFLGGLILNVMPCVLPVLSIKLASALKSSDQSLARIRTGFLVSALGVLSFMLALAAILMVLRATGGQVGWGIQFQNPVFLSAMVLIMLVFAANLAGLFEITLPQSWTTGMANAEGRSGLIGDFATGALAAVMATPCSAPFLGTAVAVALAGSNLDTLAIFAALGLGLSLPYLLFALRPSLIQKLPKPGAWMNVVKLILAAMMAATCIWLATVLATIIGPIGTGIVLAGGAIAVWALHSNRLRAVALGVPVVAVLLASQFNAPIPELKSTSYWAAFDETRIMPAVAEGQVVFVDVTAAWCLTCKANKSLVLDRAEIASLLSSDEVTAMQADWTRPNPDILAYLQANGRFGIPFNILYGPGAPDGIALPEILTPETVLAAMAKAKG